MWPPAPRCSSSPGRGAPAGSCPTKHLTFADIYAISFIALMTVNAWLKARAVELGAALCTATILIGGLAICVPFLVQCLPDGFLSSLRCETAALLLATIYLALCARHLT